MSVRAKIEDLINQNYRQPAGVFGRVAGRRMVHQHQPENERSVSLLAIQPTDHVLEVGFGPGLAIQLLADQAREGLVAGVDYSHTMVSVARRRNRRAVRAGQVDLRYGEATKLPFADATFDKALSIHAMYFWARPVKALTELHRVLKPGGTLVLSVALRELPPEQELAASSLEANIRSEGVLLLHEDKDNFEPIENNSEQNVFHEYTGPEVVALLHKAGFSHARIDIGPVRRTFREIAVVATKERFA